MPRTMLSGGVVLRTLLVAGFAIALVAGCNLGTGPEPDDEVENGEEPDDGDDGFTEMLEKLGIRVDSVPDRLDPDGNPVDEDSNPLGGRQTTLMRHVDVFFTGLEDRVTGSSYGAGFWDADLQSIDDAEDTDDSWTRFFHRSVEIDLTGDGRDEVVVMYYNDDTEEIVFRVLNPTAGTYRNAATFPHQEVCLGDDFWYRQDIEAADITGDGKPEILVVNADRFMILDTDFTTLHDQDVPPLDDDPDKVVARIATADFTEDGRSEIVLVNGYSGRHHAARGFVYDWGDGGPRILHGGNTGFEFDNEVNVADVATGDFNGNGIPQIAFAGNKDDGDGNWCHYRVMDVSRDPDGRLHFDVLDTIIGQDETPQHRFVPVDTGDLTGNGRDEIVAYNTVLRLNDDGGLERLGTVSEPNQSMLRVGDATGNGKADIVLGLRNRDGLQIWSVNTAGDLEITRMTTPTDRHERSGSLCLPDVQGRSNIVSYLGHSLQFTDPRIIAALASPPYWDGLDQNLGGTSLSFGQSESTTTEIENSYGFQTSWSVGTKIGFNVFGIGAEAEIKAVFEQGFTRSFAESTQTTVTRQFTTVAGEDSVVFACVPFDVYYYEIVSSNDPESVGEEISINIPRRPILTSQSRDYYNAHNGDGVDIDSSVLGHAPGDPFSYPTYDDMREIRSRHGDGLYTSSGNAISVGQGTGYHTLSIDDLTTERESFKYTQSIGMQAQVSAVGVLVGSGFKFEYGYEYSTSMTDGTHVAVSVGHLRDADEYQSHQYTFGLMAYPERAGDQEFTVVTCWVEE